MAYLSNFRQKFETVVSPAYMERANGEILALRDGYVDFSTWCITKFVQLIFVIDFKLVMPDFFTPKWYGSSAMKQMVVTFEETSFARSAQQVARQSAAARPAQCRGLASAASSSGIYEPSEASGVKLAARDSHGPT
ncbi:hypothetical protein BN1708_017001, partial [Verticillium longisporum]